MVIAMGEPRRQSELERVAARIARRLWGGQWSPVVPAVKKKAAWP